MCIIPHPIYFNEGNIRSLTKIGSNSVIHYFVKLSSKFILKQHSVGYSEINICLLKYQNIIQIINN